jgi:3-oxoadipate enol-lactonase
MPFLERPGEPRLHYEIDDFTDPWKHAPYILLQHAQARSSRFWYSWVPYLSRFYKVIRLDLRGLGQSGRDFDRDALKVETYLPDFRDLLDHLGIESVHFCGELSSGILGMAFAAEFPRRVRTLSLVSSPVYMTHEDKTSALGGHASRIEAIRKAGGRAWLEASNAGRRFPSDSDPGFLAWNLDEMAKSDDEMIIAYFRWASESDATPYLSKISAPVLGLYPSQGVIVKEEHLDLLRARVKDIRIVRIPSRSQTLHLSAPRSCALEVLHFIAQYDGIAGSEN